MGDDRHELQRWFALVRLEKLPSGLIVMNVVDSFPTRAEALEAFLTAPDKHALAVSPTSFFVRLEPGDVLPMLPGRRNGPTWAEEIDRAVDQALGRPCFSMPPTMAEQAREAGRGSPSSKVVDLDEYRRQRLGLDQEL